MRNEDTPLGGAQGHSVHQHLGQELTAAGMTSRHAHVPTAQGIATAPAPFVVQANAQRVMPGIDGVVTLPAGVELSDVHAVGRDLVVNLPDGTQMIIVDGAVFVPELVIGNVEVPATNLAALLIDAEPKPAAGLSQSSGGNFAVPVGPLDPGAPLGNLLPPTDFGYTPPQFKEIAPFINNKPSVVIDTPDQPAGAANATASVNEGALPIGSNPTSTAETTTGTIVVTSLDNPTSVSINGVDVTGIGQVIHGAYGDLTITNIVNGVISYSYTLGAPTTGDTTHDLFTVVVTDRDGDTANATLDVTIVDDVPTAHADTNSVGEGSTLNVAASGVLGNDVSGADGYAAGGGVVGVAAGTNTAVALSSGVGTAITTSLGTLTLYGDGHYTYVSNANAVTSDTVDHFVYTIKDADGDTSTVTLDITVNNVTLSAQNVTGSVFEAALDLTQGGADLAAGTVTGSNPGSTGETVTGTLVNAFAAVNGYTPQTVTDSLGTFALDSSGHYTYTLTSPIIGPQANNGTNNEVPLQALIFSNVTSIG
ncbi:hypothetical protein [Sphingomonas sp.]|uniref:Ig-like domain-containing protein n=1 Tax=Sphingomonas sp. TaxID=28214 RepID=UPI00325FAB99